MRFEFGKMKMMSNYCKNNFGGEVARDKRLFEVSQRKDDSEKVKKARIGNA